MNKSLPVLEKSLKFVCLKLCEPWITSEAFLFFSKSRTSVKNEKYLVIMRYLFLLRLQGQCRRSSKLSLAIFAVGAILKEVTNVCYNI